MISVRSHLIIYAFETDNNRLNVPDRAFISLETSAFKEPI